eukprot:SAG22_NODE_2238_length_2804_cov_2.080591_3_plen_181_part_00
MCYNRNKRKPLKVPTLYSTVHSAGQCLISHAVVRADSESILGGLIPICCVLRTCTVDKCTYSVPASIIRRSLRLSVHDVIVDNGVIPSPGCGARTTTGAAAVTGGVPATGDWPTSISSILRTSKHSVAGLCLSQDYFPFGKVSLRYAALKKLDSRVRFYCTSCTHLRTEEYHIFDAAVFA